MKNNIYIFILGTLTALLIISIFIFNGYLFYNLGNHFVEFIESKTQKKEKLPEFIFSHFNLTFENKKEMEIFNARDAYAEISSKFFSEGKKSLMVEFPGGRSNPGIFFDIINTRCLNWGNINTFSFKVFNNVDAKARLTVQIKSGEKYPKRVFRKEYSLLPLSWNDIVIIRKELEANLDLNKISHLTLAVIEPFTTFKLYFDEMKTNEK